MPLLVSEAIVLHAFDYLESSRIVRLVTRDAGMRSGLAKGVPGDLGPGRLIVRVVTVAGERGEGWFEDYWRLLEARCPGVWRAQRDTDWSRDSVAATGEFESVGQTIIPWVRSVSIETWMRDQRSHSYVIALTKADRARLLREAQAILHAGFPEGQMAVAYQCRLWLARRR